MGPFLFKVQYFGRFCIKLNNFHLTTSQIRLSEVEDTELLDKRGYLTIVLNTVREGKILLRKTEGLIDWYNIIKVRFLIY